MQFVPQVSIGPIFTFILISMGFLPNQLTSKKSYQRDLKKIEIPFDRCTKCFDLTVMADFQF